MPQPLNAPSAPTPHWRRPTLGAMALTLLCFGCGLRMFGRIDPGWIYASGVMINVGTTFLIAWLAYPQLIRLQPQKVLAAVAIVFVLITRPQFIPPLVRTAIILSPILVLLWLIKSPQRKS